MNHVWLQKVRFRLSSMCFWLSSERFTDLPSPPSEYCSLCVPDLENVAYSVLWGKSSQHCRATSHQSPKTFYDERTWQYTSVTDIKLATRLFHILTSTSGAASSTLVKITIRTTYSSYLSECSFFHLSVLTFYWPSLYGMPEPYYSLSPSHLPFS